MFCFVFLALISSAVCQNGYDLQAPSNSYGAPQQNDGYSNGDLSADASNIVEDPIAALASLIPGGGVPGEDYPILASVPETGFSCADQEYPGYYADTADEAGCQVFHICQEGGQADAFLCPNGTLFQQKYFVCDWWFNVDCAASADFYGSNAEIGVIPESADASTRNDAQYGAASDVSQISNSYGAPSRDAGAPAPPPTNTYGTPARF